ncbi:MAG: hypothetical protein KDK78_11960, partial [Chlamydiia bacterium]|nr:hypothetical protein [Chlamydiia bacterium]
MELGCDSLLLSMFRVVQDHRFRFDRCFTEVHTKAQMHDLFHLVHLDSLDLKREEDGIPTSEVLKTGSSLLAGFAGRQDLDEKQRIKLESLQRGLRFAANLNKFCSPIGNAARNLADFKAAVLKEFKEQGDTVLATGWSGNPGHFILMELHYREGQVSGSISNTGAGVSLHPLVLIEGHKIKRGNTLYLESVSEEEFSNSIFLHLLWNLQSYSEPVHSEKDFYHTFLASWPGEIRTADASVVYHSTQSGPTCTFRPLQQVAKDVLSPALGRLYKVYVQIATLLPRLSYIEGKDTIREIDQLIYATAQISRRVYRMATAGELSPAQERDLTTLCREVRKHLLRVRREYLAQIGYRSCSPKIEGIDLDPITVRSKVSNKSRDSELSEAIEIPAVNREQTIQAFQENVDAAQRLALYLHKQEAADFAIETLLNLPQEVLERPTDDQFEALLSLFKWELMQIENKAGAPRLSVRRGLASLLGFMACLNYCAAQDKGLPFARFHRFLLRDYLLSGNQLRRIKHPGDLAVYQRLLEELERLPCEGSQPDIKRADISYGFKLQWYGHSLQDLLNKHGELASLAALSGDPALDFLYGEQLENSWPKSIPKWHKEVSSQAYRLYSVCFSQLNNLTKPGRIGVSKSLSDGCGVWFAAGVGGWFHDSIEGCTSLSVLNDGTAVNFTAFNDIQNVRNSMEFNVHSASLAQTQTSKVVQGMTTQQAEEFLVIGSDPSLLLLRWTQFIQRYPVLLNNQIPCYHIEAVLFLPYQDEYPIDALRHALDFHRSLDAVIKLCQDANWKDAVLSL